MKLYEFQAKEVFSRFGIPVPDGKKASTADEAFAAARELGRCVVKAQVHVGGRGKAGGIKLANTPDEARAYAAGMLGKPLKGFMVNHVLVEQALDIASEYYFAIAIDRVTKGPIMMASSRGGIDIEEVAASQPENIAKAPIDLAYGPHDFAIREVMARAQFAPGATRAASAIVRNLYQVFVENDASLVEVNPLVVTATGEVLAADAKFDIDDNALFRQERLTVYREESDEDPVEAEAHRRGVAYVRLDGDIGVIGNGAGLVMTTLDIVTREGGRPANFLDIGGGAMADAVKEAIAVVLMNPNVKGILFNIFGGITRGDEVARGILEGTATLDTRVPIVVRMAGTRAEEGQALLRGTSLVPAASPTEAARKIIELARQQ